MKKLLLHVCCAPCASYSTIERLAPRFSVTWFFYNPNLNSKEEYLKRLEAVQFVSEKFNIPLIVDEYEHERWLSEVAGHEDDSERGPRCRICCHDRLARTVMLAGEQGFDYFSTSLLVSPYKDTESIRRMAMELSEGSEVEFLDEDLQSENGYRLSQDFAKKLDIYRQRYCGCEYSKPKEVAKAL